ncbi:cation:proton antiporter [Candidatus Woesearchaeota archaeon]|nr:cation:proton antiporter [Candidatus Woesearchaeota archaeon]
MDTLTVVTLCLIVSFILSQLSRFLDIPVVVGQILAGVILGLPIIRHIFTPESLNDVSFLADIGIIFLLLYVGLRMDLTRLKRVGKDTVLIGIATMALPFILGVAFMKAAGYSTTPALVVGACLSITAEGTTIKTLIDVNALTTKVGTIIIGAGLLDDVFEVLFLSLVLMFAQGSTAQVAFFPAKLLLFVLVAYGSYRLFPKLFRLIQKEHSRVTTFTSMIIFALIVAVVSTKLDLGPIIGALLAGIIIKHTEKYREDFLENLRELELMTFGFIIPFFFINIGLLFDVSTFVGNFWIILFVFFVGLVGKIAGALIMTPFTDLSFKQTYLIGWGMNSRGAVELVIAEIARQAGLLPPEIYTAIVVMAVTTTLIFPFVMKHTIKSDRTFLNA